MESTKKIQSKLIPESKEKSEIPKPIRLSALLIYISVGISLANAILMETTPAYSYLIDIKGLIVLVLSLGLLPFIGFKIYTGIEWARTALLILLILGWVMYPFTLIDFFSFNQMSGIISILQAGLELTSLILLYRKDANLYYKEAGDRES